MFRQLKIIFLTLTLDFKLLSHVHSTWDEWCFEAFNPTLISADHIGCFSFSRHYIDNLEWLNFIPWNIFSLIKYLLSFREGQLSSFNRYMCCVCLNTQRKLEDLLSSAPVHNYVGTVVKYHTSVLFYSWHDNEKYMFSINVLLEMSWNDHVITCKTLRLSASSFCSLNHVNLDWVLDNGQ